MRVIQGIKEPLDVYLQHPPTMHLHHLDPQHAQRIVGRPPWPETVRAIQKVLLIDRFQHHDHRPLKHLVLEGGNADRARLAALSALRDVHTPHWRRPVHARLRAVQQRLEVGLQVRRVLFRGLFVHAHGAILARAPVCFLEPVDVDVMGKREERHRRRLLRQLRYALDFR